MKELQKMSKLLSFQLKRSLPVAINLLFQLLLITLLTTEKVDAIDRTTVFLNGNTLNLNGTFETVLPASPGYPHGVTRSSWVLSSSAGISRNNTAFTSGNQRVLQEASAFPAGKCHCGY